MIVTEYYQFDFQFHTFQLTRSILSDDIKYIIIYETRKSLTNIYTYDDDVNET